MPHVSSPSVRADASSFSLTAFIVARSLIALSHHPRWHALVSPETIHYQNIFMRVGASSSWLARLVGNLPDAVFLWLMDHCNVYGMALHFVLRKALIETTVAEAMQQGIRQVVILGAGFDSLALRLHKENRSVTFFEIDRAETQQVKQDALQHELDNGLQDNIVFLPCDLSVQGALREALVGHSSFDVSQKSLFILEGLCMYLTDNENTELFAEMRALSTPGSQVIFGALDSSEAQTKWLTRYILAYRKENYRWSITPARMQAWLEKNHYALTKTHPFASLQQNYRTPRQLERLSRQTGENYYLANAA